MYAAQVTPSPPKPKASSSKPRQTPLDDALGKDDLGPAVSVDSNTFSDGGNFSDESDDKPKRKRKKNNKSAKKKAATAHSSSPHKRKASGAAPKSKAKRIKKDPAAKESVNAKRKVKANARMPLRESNGGDEEEGEGEDEEDERGEEVDDDSTLKTQREMEEAKGPRAKAKPGLKAKAPSEYVEKAQDEDQKGIDSGAKALFMPKFDQAKKRTGAAAVAAVTAAATVARPKGRGSGFKTPFMNTRVSYSADDKIGGRVFWLCWN